MVHMDNITEKVKIVWGVEKSASCLKFIVLSRKYVSPEI